MSTLIVDRTEAHVELLKSLRKKRWVDMSEEERTLWYTEAAKGAYNYTDLNRVESAVAELAVRFGLELTTKTDWTMWDVPTYDEMLRYLNNIRQIQDACPDETGDIALPWSMGNLTIEYANNIEKVLLYASGSRLGSGRLGSMVLSGATT